MIGQLSPMYTVRKLCHVLSVSRAGYYAWRSRLPSRRWHDDERLKVAILAAHNRTRQTYGARRLQPELAGEGHMAGRDRISRLRRELGLRCKQRRKYRVTTDSNHKLPVAENKVGRNFHATAPDQLWLADITYLPTDEGWVYLAGIKDMFTRQIVGHSMAERMGVELVRDALENALRTRKPTAGMVHHSDRGSQYCAADYRNVLKRHGIAVSMSRSGDCYDNAPMESFWGSMKSELVNQKRWGTREEVKSAVVEYIEIFYNRQRRHSALGYLAPAAFAKKHEMERVSA